uniref:Cation-transporting P-type ATPase n=1 Tax=candidate division WWE3 bacterium TaxID=2053526 RepID=A0A7C4XGS4_UNCKA
MSFSKYTNLSVSDVLAEFSTSIDTGLTQSVIKKRQDKSGPNAIRGKETTWLDVLGRQFKSTFVYLLLTAVVISFVLGEELDGFMILLFITINTVLGFYQEYGSEKTMKYLKTYMIPKATVIRNGQESVIESYQLVPGDVVVLETGDIVPADLRIVKENNLFVDESSLTGESFQIKKTSDKMFSEETEPYKAKNIVFAGTHVAEGKALGVVVSIGKDSEFGKITKLATETFSQSGFEKQINKFSRFILVMTLGTLAAVFLAHLFIDGNLEDLPSLALFAIALAVGVIPEALPLVATFSLTHGANVLAKKKVVVKRLSAIEDLGGIEVLCSDKTGTLTENKLKVVEINSPDIDKTVYYGLLASDYIGKERTSNNSFDLALIEKMGKERLDGIKRTEKIFEIPFNPERKRNSVLVKEDSRLVLIVRGAQENVLPYIKGFSHDTEKELIDWILGQGHRGRRVLAIAKRNFDGISTSYSVKDEEADLEFVGLVSFADPIKPTTKLAVEKAEELGIRVKIITGDSAEVSGAVAHEVGIIESPAKVLTGYQFDRMKPHDQEKAVKDFDVFARLSPEQKYKIISQLQKHYSVGYLGEGINDAPALKISDVALVVNDASDVARGAADIVLLEQDLKVIVDGIEEGRKTFSNTTKYIKSTLASNFGNFYAVAFASLLIDYLPMLPIQILLVNLLSDFPMIAIATDNVDQSEIKKPHSYDIREITLIAMLLGMISTLFDFVVFGLFYKMGPAHLQTNWFIASILTELLLIFSIRSKKFFLRPTTGPSIQMRLLTLVAAVITIIIPFTKIGTEVFKFTNPGIENLGLIISIVILYIFSSEAVKLYYYKVSHSLNN